MRKLSNVNEVSKGDKVFVKDVSVMWDSKKEEYYNVCFEYVFEVVRNNKKTLGCTHLNGPYRNSGFNWIKGYDLTTGKKEYFLIEDESEVIERHYNVE
jgi:hypothetical protein